MTYQELKKKCEKVGLKVRQIDMTFQRGYVSVKQNSNNAEIFFVPETSKRRRGQAYYLEHNFHSTRYCYRIYLNVSRETLERLDIL